MYQRLEKQTDEAGRKSVVSTPEYRGDVRRRGGGGAVVVKHSELERKHMKSISPSLPPSVSPSLLPPSSPTFPCVTSEK